MAETNYFAQYICLAANAGHFMSVRTSFRYALTIMTVLGVCVIRAGKRLFRAIKKAASSDD